MELTVTFSVTAQLVPSHLIFTGGNISSPITPNSPGRTFKFNMTFSPGESTMTVLIPAAAVSSELGANDNLATFTVSTGGLLVSTDRTSLT